MTGNYERKESRWGTGEETKDGNCFSAGEARERREEGSWSEKGGDNSCHLNSVLLIIRIFNSFVARFRM